MLFLLSMENYNIWRCGFLWLHNARIKFNASKVQMDGLTDKRKPT
jgi:hypothetical protein